MTRECFLHRRVVVNGASFTCVIRETTKRTNIIAVHKVVYDVVQCSYQ